MTLNYNFVLSGLRRKRDRHVDRHSCISSSIGSRQVRSKRVGRLLLAMAKFRFLVTFLSSQLDFNVNAGRKIKFHQCVDGLWSRINNIKHPLVCTDFKLFTGFLVNMR